MFNVLHNEYLINVDCILLKPTEFEQTAFARRRKVRFAEDLELNVISHEDLIVSKLLWARKGKSGRQLEDVVSLMRFDFDEEYVLEWVLRLGLVEEFNASKERIN